MTTDLVILPVRLVAVLTLPLTQLHHSPAHPTAKYINEHPDIYSSKSHHHGEVLANRLHLLSLQMLS